MTAEGKDFTEVLAEAQKLGYAEADPGLDVDGGDSAHKATILASLAHGFWTGYDNTYVEGIRHISQFDIQIARERLNEAQANRQSAWEQFFPWIAAGVGYHRRDGVAQAAGTTSARTASPPSNE